MDSTDMGVEILEYWQRLKIHSMSLKRYLGERNIELLKCKVESSNNIELKSFFRWLFNKNRLKKNQVIRKQDSSIEIIVQKEAEAKTLYASVSRFIEIVRVVEKY